MCVEKTPWEQVIDFHGHTCPGIALGFRISQIAMRELGIKPAPDSELIVKAETKSCALDAFQVLNHATIGRGTLLVEERGKHVYFFQYSMTTEILRISILPEIIDKISALGETVSPRLKQNKSLEAIQFILSSKEEEFCSIQMISGKLEKSVPASLWAKCPQCGESVLKDYTVHINELNYCLECAEKV